MKQRHPIGNHAKPVRACAGEPVLRVRNLSVQYNNRTGANFVGVRNATFCISHSEIAGLFGPSGSGKTSLGLALANLLPSSAIRSADSIELQGDDLLGFNEQQMRSVRGQRISIMYQEPALSLNPLMLVGQQISEIIRAHGECKRLERRARALELLRSVGLGDATYDSYPHELSGGERHRVVIAQALACRPALVIADEPTAGLDPKLKAEVLKLIVRFRNEMGISFLVISHDRQMLSQISDRMLEMNHGCLSESQQAYREIAHTVTTDHPAPGTGREVDSGEPLLSVHGLSKSFGKHNGLFTRRSLSVPALRDVSLTIWSGSCFGLTGPSGSGKSSLARCIAGWESPDSGQIFFHGSDLTRARSSARNADRFRIQLVLQDSASALNPNLTAEEIVAEPLLIQQQSNKQQRRAAVKRLFLETGLDEEMLRRKPLTFSGGQRQRLAIARALILNPELVIFDESTTGLDFETQEQILRLLMRLKAARNLTYILISHDASLLSVAADRVATMQNGTIANLSRCSEPSQPFLDVLGTGDPIEAGTKAFATGEPA